MISEFPAIGGRHPARLTRGGAVAVGLMLTLASCAGGPVSSGINDPNEAQNREIHEFNLAVDSKILKPVSGALGGDGQGPLQKGVANFAENIGLPAVVLNDVLQLRLGKALENTVRFSVNTVVGIGGLLDPASAMGVTGDKTDFGETLHVWGVEEGPYVELPFVGPSTSRDTLGMIVDLMIDPVSIFLPEPERYVGIASKMVAKVGDRARYSETVDSILYDSADSYAQARLLYLQNRRFELGQVGDDSSFEDPYEDSYGQ